MDSQLIFKGYVKSCHNCGHTSDHPSDRGPDPNGTGADPTGSCGECDICRTIYAWQTPDQLPEDIRNMKSQSYFVQDIAIDGYNVQKTGVVFDMVKAYASTCPTARADKPATAERKLTPFAGHPSSLPGNAGFIGPSGKLYHGESSGQWHESLLHHAKVRLGNEDYMTHMIDHNNFIKVHHWNSGNELHVNTSHAPTESSKRTLTHVMAQPHDETSWDCSCGKSGSTDRSLAAHHGLTLRQSAPAPRKGEKFDPMAFNEEDVWKSRDEVCEALGGEHNAIDLDQLNQREIPQRASIICRQGHHHPVNEMHARTFGQANIKCATPHKSLLMAPAKQIIQNNNGQLHHMGWVASDFSGRKRRGTEVKVGTLRDHAVRDHGVAMCRDYGDTLHITVPKRGTEPQMSTVKDFIASKPNRKVIVDSV